MLLVCLSFVLPGKANQTVSQRNHFYRGGGGLKVHQYSSRELLCMWLTTLPQESEVKQNHWNYNRTQLMIVWCELVSKPERVNLLWSTKSVNGSVVKISQLLIYRVTLHGAIPTVAIWLRSYFITIVHENDCRWWEWFVPPDSCGRVASISWMGDLEYWLIFNDPRKEWLGWLTI